ncbi:MAG TPA: hypothetical protein VN428_09420 [Bryobacteraceae bacterium]|nr:hypothetical protein [Bryobacteraceae bacterium]
MPDLDETDGGGDDFDRSRERTRSFFRTLLIAAVVFAFLYVVRSAGPFT